MRLSSTFWKLIISAAITINLLMTLALIRTLASPHSCIQRDAHYRIVLKPGSILSRSIDSTGVGMNYHFTRYDSYKASDWKPQSP